MPIEKNQVVLFHYSARDEQGNIVEESRADHGVAGEIIELPV